MNYYVARVALIAMLLGALMLGAPPATSAPTGKMVTSEITIAGGLVAYFLTYESALLRSKGSVKQAEQVMRATTDIGFDGPVSLNQIRGLIIVDIANSQTKDQGRWRDEFENFRFCWNKTLAIDPSAPESKTDDTTAVVKANASATSRTSGAKAAYLPATTLPAPTETPTAAPYRKPSCSDLVGNLLENIGKDRDNSVRKLNIEVDLSDLHAALASAPSLYSQVRKQEVGSHVLDNYLQARFLTVAGKYLAALIAAPSAERTEKLIPITSSTVLQSISNCYQPVSPGDCVGQFAQIEDTLAAVQKQRDACAWDRHVWLPPYSAIKMWATLPSGTWHDLLGQPPGFVILKSLLNVKDYNAPTIRPTIDRVDMMALGSPPGC